MTFGIKSVTRRVTRELRTPRVGIVMPAYNAAPWIQDAVRTVLLQDDERWHLLVVDDGSTDGTSEIVRRCAGGMRSRKAQVTVCSITHIGLPSAINMGMTMLPTFTPVTPEFVMQMSADDMLAENYVSTMLAVHDAVDTPCVYAPVQEFGTRSCTWLPPQPWQPGQVRYDNTTPACGMWRKRAWDAVGAWDTRWDQGGEDWYWSACAEAKGVIGPECQPRCTYDTKYFHRAHANSLTDRMPPAYRAQLRAAIADLFVVALAEHWPPQMPEPTRVVTAPPYTLD